MSSLAITGALLRPEGKLRITRREGARDSRDAVAISDALSRIDGCSMREGREAKLPRGDDPLISELYMNGVVAYSSPFPVGQGSFGTIRRFRRVSDDIVGPKFVCVKTYKTSDVAMAEFEVESGVVNMLGKAEEDDGAHRMRARAAHLTRVHDDGPAVTVILMEYGEGSLEKFKWKLNTRVAASVTRAMLEEMRAIYRVSGLVSSDCTLENFLYVTEPDGGVIVMAADYGGYAKEGGVARTARHMHPTYSAEEDTVVNIANCIFTCGLSFLDLLTISPNQTANETFWWDQMYLQELTAMLRNFNESAPPATAALVNAMLRFNPKTGLFERTQGRGAAPGDFDDILQLVSEVVGSP